VCYSLAASASLYLPISMLMGIAKPTKPISSSSHGEGNTGAGAIPLTAAIKPVKIIYSKANIIMPVNTAWLIRAANLTFTIFGSQVLFGSLGFKRVSQKSPSSHLYV